MSPWPVCPSSVATPVIQARVLCQWCSCRFLPFHTHGTCSCSCIGSYWEPLQHTPSGAERMETRHYIATGITSCTAPEYLQAACMTISVVWARSLARPSKRPTRIPRAPDWVYFHRSRDRRSPPFHTSSIGGSDSRGARAILAFRRAVGAINHTWSGRNVGTEVARWVTCSYSSWLFGASPRWE